MPSNIGDLADQRQRILDLISQAGNVYQTDPLAQQQAGFFQAQPWQTLMSQISNRASGQDVPYTQSVINSLLGQQSDAIGQGFGQAQQQVNQGLSRRGLGGSGLGLSAMAGLRSQATAQQIAGRREITSRAQLNNFQARAQAQQQLQGAQGQQFQGQQQFLQGDVANRNLAAQREIDFRSRMQEIAPGLTPRQQQGQDWVTRTLSAHANSPIPSGFRTPAWQTDAALRQRSHSSSLFNATLAGLI